MVEIKMTKGKWKTVGALALFTPFLEEWHCEAIVNSQVLKQSYINFTKSEAKAKFKQLIKERQKAWFEHLAK